MKKYVVKRTKSLGLFCLTLSFVVSIVLFAHSSLASAQNKTLIQPIEIRNTTFSNIKNIILVHGAFRWICMKSSNSYFRKSRS